MAKKDEGSAALILVMFLFLLTPVSALLTAKIFSIAWGLLLAPQYGDGPTYQSWYGVACMTSLITRNLATKQTEPSESVVGSAIRDIIASYAGMGVIVGIAAFVRFAVGWP